MRNECAQRAAAHLLSQHLGGDWRGHYAQLRRTHPPDTPFRLLGTTPARVAKMLSDSGLDASLLTRATRDDVRPGALACIDLRPLHGGLPRLHWVLIDDVAPHGVRAEERWHAWDRWMRAWSCRASPFAMHRRALVHATR